MERNTRLKASALPLLLVTSACVTAQPRPPVDTAASLQDPRVGELQKQLETMKNKIDGLEFKLGTLNDKIDATRTSVDTLGKTREPETGTQDIKTPLVDQVIPAGLAAAGAVAVNKMAGDPETGFVTDAPVQAYRRAMVLFEASKHPEAILGFTQFLDQYADHPFAGSAQYHIGLSYIAQKECKLAVQELSRVLTSYDRSPHVPDALAELTRCEDQLKLTKQASEHRQLLLSLYPNSTAARSLPPAKVDSDEARPLPATAPVPEGKPQS